MDQRNWNLVGKAVPVASHDAERTLVDITSAYAVGLSMAETVVRVEQEQAVEGSDAWIRLKRAADAIVKLRLTAPHSGQP